MKILEIHQIEPWMLRLSGSIYTSFDIITFDDALYSQYAYIDFFAKFNKPLWFFWSTGIVRPDNIDPVFKVCDTAHKDAIINNDFSGYMNISEIEYCFEHYNVGMHGHSHKCLDKLKGLNKLKVCLDETDKMVKIYEFYRKNRHHPGFCCPYNDVSYYRSTLKKYYDDIFITGPERIPIETFDEKKESLMPLENLVWKNYANADCRED